jgi:hypothetical protein
MCAALSLVSRATWELVSYSFAKKLAGAPRTVDERAVTDVAMTALEAFSGGAAGVTLFTIGQEATTGADFELQVFDASGYRLSFLCQGKALKLDQAPPGNEGYPALADDSPGGGRQYTQLQVTCDPGGRYPDSAPMHVFYNGALLSSGQPWPDDACGTSGRDEQARGITIAHTKDVDDAIHDGPVSYRVGRIAPVCWPWWCFFCQGSPTLADLAARAGTRPLHPGFSPGGAGPPTPPEPAGPRDRIRKEPIVQPPERQPVYARLARERSRRDRQAETEFGGRSYWERIPISPEEAPPARAVFTLELDAGSQGSLDQCA